MSSHSPLLTGQLQELQRVAKVGPVLDLACGGGRNGLHLIANRIPVTFADRSSQALQQVKDALAESNFGGKRQLADFWQVDFEQENIPVLVRNRFSAVLVFRYLHRPLMAQIMQTVKPGGVIIYETFTVDQPRYGRPTNPDYLLRHNELLQHFPDWRVLHHYEGLIQSDSTHQSSAVAQ